ncbi:hypothetical protein V500_07603 [Pseudogymnoascus sp. VKM F-4518 (FW-2643)]|nr:hypothetical protein V500_07603 [Pseudogymnoascus sp. VKM F-4518 (FW-2643)]
MSLPYHSHTLPVSGSDSQINPVPPDWAPEDSLPQFSLDELKSMQIDVIASMHLKEVAAHNETRTNAAKYFVSTLYWERRCKNAEDQLLRNGCHNGLPAPDSQSHSYRSDTNSTTSASRNVHPGPKRCRTSQNDGQNERCIFWLNGLAGTGKSTVSLTVARRYNEQKRLGASFFFSKGDGDVSHAVKFFTTSLAVQLGRTIPSLQKQIYDAITERNKKDVCEMHAPGSQASQAEISWIEKCLPPKIQYVYLYYLQRGGFQVQKELSGYFTGLRHLGGWARYYEGLKQYWPWRLTFRPCLRPSPEESIIRETLKKCIPTWIERKPRVQAHWSAALQTLEGHSRMVNSVAFSPDSKQIISGSADNTVRLWEATTGAALQTLKGHWSNVNSVAISPDGKLLPTLYVLNDWLVEGTTNLLWLPTNYRPTCKAVWNKLVVLGHSSGRISMRAQILRCSKSN